MKNALQFLFVAFWLFVSCMPIIFIDWPPESPDNQYHLNK